MAEPQSMADPLTLLLTSYDPQRVGPPGAPLGITGSERIGGGAPALDYDEFLRQFRAARRADAAVLGGAARGAGLEAALGSLTELEAESAAMPVLNGGALVLALDFSDDSAGARSPSPVSSADSSVSGDSGAEQDAEQDAGQDAEQDAALSYQDADRVEGGAGDDDNLIYGDAGLGDADLADWFDDADDADDASSADGATEDVAGATEDVAGAAEDATEDAVAEDGDMLAALAPVTRGPGLLAALAPRDRASARRARRATDDATEFITARITSDDAGVLPPDLIGALMARERSDAGGAADLAAYLTA